MNETRRRRLALIWTAFALVMTYITLADGFTLDIGDLLGAITTIQVGSGLFYYVNIAQV